MEFAEQIKLEHTPHSGCVGIDFQACETVR